MSLITELCKALNHDWIAKDYWTFCKRCDVKWDYNKHYCGTHGHNIQKGKCVRCPVRTYEYK